MKRKNPINAISSAHIYAPNSIYHGSKIVSTSSRDAALLLQIEVDRLNDFIEFLFEHSEHCDHISQREAWKEFEVYEIRHSYYRQLIQEERKK